MSYKEAVVGKAAACEKGLERKSFHFPGLCRDEQSIGGAIMNRVRGDFCQPLPYIPQEHASRKLPGQQNLGSDCSGKIELAENVHDGSNQLHRGGGGGKGKSPAWEGEKRAWSSKSQIEGRKSNGSEGFGGTEHDPSSNDSKEHACVTLSRVIKETTGSGSTSRLTKYIAATGGGCGALSTPLEITEKAAACSTLGGTEKNFFPPQNKGSLVLERTRGERKSIPVVSAKALDAEEKRSSSTRSQNVSGGCTLTSCLPTFPNKKTVYFFPKTLNLPNYTFDMIYYQDPGESGQQIC